MNEYLNIFIDKEYPDFLDKYLSTKTFERLKYITQFCGSDYTNLYKPRFLYTRYDHSLVVAHMTWHFTHNKTETILALLHDIGTPCFAHCIDYVFDDYLEQESSEREIVDIVLRDVELLNYLKEDNVDLEELKDLTKYSILENKSPKLCTDRLDGVFHTCYVWLNGSSLKEIKEVYDNIIVLNNDVGDREIGFKDVEIAERFVSMVFIYAKELQSNTDKYVMKYVSEVVKLAVIRKLITLEDLYTKKESDIVDIFSLNFSSWKEFNQATDIVRTEKKPDKFYISFDTKKRNTIPLVKTEGGNKRVNIISEEASNIYLILENYSDFKYGYVDSIDEID